MITRSKRIVTSFVGGTPDARSGKGVTDIICSPEVVEELRAIAYNPINTKGASQFGVRSADFIALMHTTLLALLSSMALMLLS